MADIYFTDEQGFMIFSGGGNSLAEDEPTNNEVSSEESPVTDENSNEDNNAENGNREEEEDPILSVKEELEHLQGMVESEYIHHRQVGIRKLVECIRKAAGAGQLPAAIALLYKISEDGESLVRGELVQQVPGLAVFCREHSDETRRLLRQHLVPYTVRQLSDHQIAVRKLGQSAMLVLLEDGMIDKSQLSEWICPLVSQLASCDNSPEELRIEDVNLMTKMVPFVGREITSEFFLEPFIALCADPSFGIRKICAMGFGVLCKVVGIETTENSLLGVFGELCGDVAWGIRKACADVFVDVATAVSLHTRAHLLPPLFINLLQDYSQYVKYTAYQTLGGFIYTFADPGTSGLALEGGRVVRLTPPAATAEDPNNNPPPPKEVATHPQPPCPNRGGVSVASKDEHVFVHVGGEFNEFQFWRTPLPEVELDIDLDGGGATSILVRTKVPGGGESEIKVRIAQSQADGEVQVQRVHTASRVCSFEEATFSLRDSHLLNSIKANGLVDPSAPQDPYLRLKEKEEEAPLMTPYDQNVVPPELLSRFLSAAGQHFPVGGEEERVGCCAFAFPAVALTLGPQHWPCLQVTCQRLARDNKWSVRRTMASCLHALGWIVGPEASARDLLPIFLELARDVDEVRTTLNISDFLAPLEPAWRRFFLPNIESFGKVDNDRNWRFRSTVALQLSSAVELFDAVDLMKYFLPVGLSCLEDRVHAVRAAATHLVAAVLKRMMCDERTERHFQPMLQDLSHYLRSNKWVWRQTYVMLCAEFAAQGSVPGAVFGGQVAPLLLPLAWDPVPNVRLVLARCIAYTLRPRGLFAFVEESLLEAVLRKLSTDPDRDVRHYLKHLPV